jgi:aminopeptidase 2
VLYAFLVRTCIELLTSEEDIKDIEKFFSNKDTKNFEKVLEQSKENIRANAGWVNHDSKDVEDWLRVNGYLT